MIGLVMAGGKGSRMQLSEEKLLLEYNQPVILNVIDALKNSNCFSKIIGVTSPNSPKTKKILEDKIEIFDTPGNGYVNDLNLALSNFEEDVFVTSGDLPLLDSEIVTKISQYYNPNTIWKSCLVTQDFLLSQHMKSEFPVSFEN